MVEETYVEPHEVVMQVPEFLPEVVKNRTHVVQEVRPIFKEKVITKD